MEGINMAATFGSAPVPVHDEQWWGYNKEHGWVVLDRSLNINKPGLKEQLFFLRCRDMSTFTVKRDTWKPPLYAYAPNYLRGLEPTLATEMTATLEGFKEQWPQMQAEIQRQYEATLPKPPEPPPAPKRQRKPKVVEAAAAPEAAPAKEEEE
jgi:hypothetical protein